MRRRSFLAGSTAAGLLTTAPALHAVAAESSLRFDRKFAFGVSTAAFQIEGGLKADGRGPSIWDKIAASDAPGAPDPFIGHYYRWRDDVALLKHLGIDAYRFSVAWPRVIPDGAGAVNPAGLDFYDRLVDALLAAKITPYLCLYHWDLPVALQQRGGWLDRGTVDAFVRYAGIVADRLGDRVKHWIPVNEALSIAYGGYAIAFYPPWVSDFHAYLTAAHHLNLAQGAVMKALAAPGRQFGTAMCLYPIRPVYDTKDDQDAATLREATTTKLFLDPLLRGRYPAAVEDGMASIVRDGDSAIIRHYVDFLGVNYYGPEYCTAVSQAPLGVDKVTPQSLPVTQGGIVIDADGLYEVLRDLRDHYGNPPVYITENGAAFPDVLTDDGKVDDHSRVDYLAEHFAAAHRAHAEGADLRGYFVWSAFDNYEWLVGFNNRYGLVYIDGQDKTRVPKASFDWYRRLIASRRFTPPALVRR